MCYSVAHSYRSIVYQPMFANSALVDFVDYSGKMRLPMLYCAKGVLRMASENLTKAKAGKNDEFYTQYEDIQSEVNAYLEYDPDVFRDKTVLLPCDDPEWSNFTRFFAQNFENFGLEKLISTSYAADSKPEFIPYQISLFESEAPQFDESKTRSHGKIFTLTRDKNQSGRIAIDDLEWNYLEGDGDFRSEEIKRLWDDAEILSAVRIQSHDSSENETLFEYPLKPLFTTPMWRHKKVG